MPKSLFALLRTLAGRVPVLELQTRGNTLVVADAGKIVAPLFVLDAEGIDKLIAILMEAGERIDGRAPAAQRALRLAEPCDECRGSGPCAHDRVRELRAAGAL